VAGDVPRGLDAEAVEELQEPSGEEVAGDVGRRVLAAIGPDPASDRIRMDSERANISFAISLSSFRPLALQRD
jgi:hypothetical protein